MPNAISTPDTLLNIGAGSTGPNFSLAMGGLVMPTVQPGPNPANPLPGSMTTPAPKPQIKAQTTTTAPAAPATQAPPPQMLPQQQASGQSFAMAQALSAIQQKLNTNNSLMQQRQLLLRQVYGPPLTEQEKTQLDPTYLPAIQSGDRQQIDAAIRMIGDAVGGTQGNLNNSVQYLTQAYNQDVTRAEQQKQQALSNVLQYASQLDDAGKKALSDLYPDLKPLITSLTENGGKFQKIGTDDTGNDIYGFVNEQQGTVTKYNPATSGSRTDRNINPVAASIAVNDDGSPNLNDPTTANWLQALQTNNINFSVEQGSNFGNRATLKFNSPQEGLDGAIVLLQNPGAKNAPSAFYWYKNHTGSQELQGINTPEEFGALPYDQKVSIVKGIYGHEQPGGQIFSEQASGSKDLQNALSSLIPRLPAASQKAAKATLNQYLASNDTEGARQFIVSTAISALPAADQSAAFGRLDAIASLNTIEGLLNQYESKGGNTNIFTGTIEDINQKVGKTSDPDLAYLQNQIVAAMVDYRRAVSGVAFTPAESKTYEDLFPSIGKVKELNSAKISSLKDKFERTEKTVLSAVLGQKNYDAVVGSQASGSDLKSQVASLGYDYDKMKADGYKDDEIKQTLGIK